MAVNERIEEPGLPALPARLRRPFAAVWISLALHAAVIALVQVVPPSAVTMGEPAIEARLMPVPAAPRATPEKPALPAPETPPPPAAAPPAPKPAPALAPSETAPPLPVATAPQPEPSPAETRPPPPAPVVDLGPAAPPPPVVVPVSPAPAVPAPIAAITSSVDLNYYSARELDVQPKALRKIQPDYPPDADRAHLSGRVRLQLKLEADGRVSEVEVVSATPPDVFEDSARKAFSAAHFSPARKNGQPVRARVLIEVEYDWDGRR